MRNRSRGISVSVLPPTWRGRYQISTGPVVAAPQRNWWREYVELIDEGYVPVAGTEQDIVRARARSCRCGERIRFRGFELIGPEGELLGYREYALCGRCREWVEF
jgi:hypothetical protein